MKTGYFAYPPFGNFSRTDFRSGSSYESHHRRKKSVQKLIDYLNFLNFYFKEPNKCISTTNKWLHFHFGHSILSHVQCVVRWREKIQSHSGKIGAFECCCKEMNKFFICFDKLFANMHSTCAFGSFCLKCICFISIYFLSSDATDKMKLPCKMREASTMAVPLP